MLVRCLSTRSPCKDVNSVISYDSAGNVLLARKVPVVVAVAPVVVVAVSAAVSVANVVNSNAAAAPVVARRPPSKAVAPATGATMPTRRS